MKTILVTGRNGFVGSGLVPELKKRFRVISVIRREREGVSYAGEELILSAVERLTAENISKYQIELIVHLAAQIRGNPRAIHANNVNSSQALFHIAQKCNIPVLCLSSTNVLFSEKLGSYAKSKKMSEELLLRSGAKYMIIRVPLVIGERSPSLEKIRTFYGNFGFFPLFGKSEGKVRPISISTLIHIIVAQIEKGEFSKEVINIIGQKDYTYREIIQEVLGTKDRARFLRMPLSLSLWVARLFERLEIRFIVSSEEIVSVNMDKNIVVDPQEVVQFVENNEEKLFLTRT